MQQHFIDNLTKTKIFFDRDRNRDQNFWIGTGTKIFFSGRDRDQKPLIPTMSTYETVKSSAEIRKVFGKGKSPPSEILVVKSSETSHFVEKWLFLAFAFRNL